MVRLLLVLSLVLVGQSSFAKLCDGPEYLDISWTHKILESSYADYSQGYLTLISICGSQYSEGTDRICFPVSKNSLPGFAKAFTHSGTGIVINYAELDRVVSNSPVRIAKHISLKFDVYEHNKWTPNNLVSTGYVLLDKFFTRGPDFKASTVAKPYQTRPGNIDIPVVEDKFEVSGPKVCD